MHEAHESQPRALALDGVRQRAEREAVDDHDRAVGERRESAARVVERRRGRERKIAVELAQIDAPAARAQTVDDAAIVEIAARARVEAPGHEKADRTRRDHVSSDRIQWATVPLSLHIVAKRRYGLLVRVIAVHALGALALLALARTVHAVFDLGPWYLAKVAVLYALGTVLCVAFVERAPPVPALRARQSRDVDSRLARRAHRGTHRRSADAGTGRCSPRCSPRRSPFLDGVDGRLARSSGMSSSFGARFDMETDSVLVLAMSMLAWQHGKAGAWVLGIGLMRYAFAAAGKALPWLAGPLTPTMRGKTVAVVQMGALSFVLAPFVPVPLSTAAAAIAFAMLVWSFAIDIGRLWRARGAHS